MHKLIAICKAHNKITGSILGGIGGFLLFKLATYSQESRIATICALIILASILFYVMMYNEYKEHAKKVS